MNFTKRQKLIKLNNLIFNSLVESPTSASLDIIDNDVILKTQGVVRIIVMKYRGLIGIHNNLPEGYSIKLNKNTIRIRNINMRRLLDDGLLFRTSGDFEITSCKIYCFNGSRFKATITNIDKDQLIGRSDTKLEDDTLVIQPSSGFTKQRLKRSYIDDDTVVGLYTSTPFKDGYTGYYNYHPKERVYLSGKVPNANSIPLYKTKVQSKSKTFEKKINTVLNRVSETQQVDRSIEVGDRPIEKRILQSKERAETIVSQIKAKRSPETKRSPEARIKAERKGY